MVRPLLDLLDFRHLEPGRLIPFGEEPASCSEMIHCGVAVGPNGSEPDQITRREELDHPCGAF